MSENKSKVNTRSHTKPLYSSCKSGTTLNKSVTSNTSYLNIVYENDKEENKDTQGNIIDNLRNKLAKTTSLYEDNLETNKKLKEENEKLLTKIENKSETIKFLQDTIEKITHDKVKTYTRDIDPKQTETCETQTDVIENGDRDDLPSLGAGEVTNTNSKLDREFFYLKELLSHKDTIISSLHDNVKSLKDQILLLNKYLTSTSLENINTAVPETTYGKETKNGMNAQEKTKETNLDKPVQNIISKEMVAKAIKSATSNQCHQPEVNTKNKSVISALSNVNKTASHLNKHHSPKQNNKTKGLIGNGASENNVTAVGVTRKAWLHVSRLNPDLETAEFHEFLTQKHRTENIICKKIIPRNVPNPTYSSFKVGIDENLEEKLLSDPQIWPKGALVNKYLFRDH